EGEPLDRAIARLREAGLLPAPDEAAVVERRFRSPLIRIPARALLVRAAWESAVARGGMARGRRMIGSWLAPGPAAGLDDRCARAHLDPADVADRYRRIAGSIPGGLVGGASGGPRGWK